jgi:hypothetical protein
MPHGPGNAGATSSQAERHVNLGESHIARQREGVVELERDGHDTTEARRLLANFEELQGMHLADRDRIRYELAQKLAGDPIPLSKFVIATILFMMNG